MVYDTQSYVSPSNSSNLDQDTEVNKPKTPHIISFLLYLLYMFCKYIEHL